MNKVLLFGYESYRKQVISYLFVARVSQFKTLILNALLYLGI